VPCNSSDLSVLTATPLVIAKKVARLLLNVHRKY
jgi:hypothetical protein